jgi:uncharacterized protein DUF4124
MRASLLIVGCLAGLHAAATLGGGINKCVQADGKTLYSSEPCPAGAVGSAIRVDAAARGESSQAKPASEQAFQKRRLAREEAEARAAKERAEKEEARQTCDQARARLGELDLGRVVGIDASGERHFLDDGEIAAEKSKARALIEKWCR